MKLSALMTLCALAVGCTTVPKKAEDLQVNQKHKILSAPAEELKQCVITVSNIITVIPSPAGPLPLKAMGEEAMVCGQIDCSAVKPDMVGFDCIPLSLLQSPKAE